MSELERLIQQHCPNGVEYKTIDELCDVFTGGEAPVDCVKGTPRSDVCKYPVYSNGINDNALYGYSATYTIDKQAVTFSSIGTIGHPTIREAYFTPIIRLKVIIPKDESIISIGFLKYILEVVDFSQNKSSVPNINAKMIKGIKIPVPPIEVQSEIVRILDNFTELTAGLTAELTAELTARKKQYEYYRDSLLGGKSNSAVIKTLGEVSSYRRGSFPQPYGKAEWYDGEGAMPFVQVADIGEDMRLVSDTKRKISKVAQPKSVFAPKGSIIISLQGSIGRIAVTQYDAYIDRTVAIFSKISKELNPKYFVYQLQRVFAEKEKTARGSTIKTITKEEFTEFPIAIPPLEEQDRIVDILDRFDALCNDISTGLPAEIEARQKQYEYYRDKLLTFKEASL